ncbi:MAG: prepilin-type N-terminal cleavage/methylation domain-containing protein [Desulfobacteraceae bacterium]|nr:prepilin-type N-terminal cleavage/methylation domain-containing protein [Desulfobacteraceae bacterium]
MNKKRSGENGFTIIELVIVLVIAGVLLFFALPTFQDVHFFSDPENALGKTIQLIDSLKRKAMTDNRDYVMHVDIAAGLIWVSDDAMDMDQKTMKAAREKGIRFSGDTLLLDVEFPGAMPLASEDIRIRFRRQGYSDMALIHLQEEENDVTLKIEPFLSRVELENRSVSFDQCM